MDAIKAIYSRRTVRTYTSVEVTEEQVRGLIDASIQAPSAMNLQRWVFAVVQDRDLLRHWSEKIKDYMNRCAPNGLISDELVMMLNEEDFNVFYDAGTLLIVCTQTSGGDIFSDVDSCLAAQNLMIAACDMGLATAPIGLAADWLNLPETRLEVGIPEDCRVVLPIIVGHQRGTQPKVPRKPAEILFWK